MRFVFRVVIPYAKCYIKIKKRIIYIKGAEEKITKFLYEELTWPEIKEVVKEDRVALILTATVEDHGPHLPVGTDVILGWEIIRRAAEKCPEDVVLLPINYHGYSPHHADFPGGIFIDGKTFIDYYLDITRSLIHHGFKRILLFNHHGSNRPWVDIIARLTLIQHPEKEIWVAMANPGGLADYRKASEEILTVPGGSSHGGESETSRMLAVRPDLVDMSKAPREIPLWGDGAPMDAPPEVDRPFIWGGEWWSAVTKSGILGDATAATKEKGEKLTEASVDALVKIIKAARAWKIRKRKDYH